MVAEVLRFGHRAPEPHPEDPAAVRRGQQPVQRHLCRCVVLDISQRANGRAAGAVKHCKECPLAHSLSPGCFVIDGPEQLLQAAVIGAADGGDDALGGGGEHDLRRQHAGDAGREAKPLHSGMRQHDGVHMAVLDHLQAGCHVAADGAEQQMRKACRKNRPPPRRRGADNGPLGQMMQQRAVAADQHIVAIGAWQRCCEAQPFRQFGRDILEGMDGKIKGAVEQRLIELAAEQRLAADIIQGFVADDIAGGRHGHDADAPLQGGPGRKQRRCEQIGLRERQGTLPCAKADFMWEAHHTEVYPGLFLCFKVEMIVLGIETSCDETAAAIVDDRRRILAHVVRAQIDEHSRWGGVVPEIAARAHLDYLPAVVRQVLGDAALAPGQLDGIAATCGPGLIGGVIVGATAAKGMAFALDKPFVAVNHLEGHALTARLTDDVPFPFLLLLVSGGHCQLLIAEGVGRYQVLGTTLDDAAGEAFDKVAKMLGLGFPGGPAVERAALAGDPAAFPLPRPLLRQAHCDFSFSGLKTAVRQTLEKLGRAPTEQEKCNLAAAFQVAVADCLVDRSVRAMGLFRDRYESGTFVVSGGVAANGLIRARLAAAAEGAGLGCVAPPLALCTDNAAMIAWAGVERLRLELRDGLDFRPRPRWPLAGGDA